MAVRIDAAVGRIESPTGVHAAGNGGADREQAADHVKVPARQIEPREGQVARADHDRDQEIAQNGGN